MFMRRLIGGLSILGLIVLTGTMSEEDAKAQMRRLTRVFVRRQANWFKDDDPSITWFYAGDENIIERVESRILAWLRGQDGNQK